MMKNNNLLWILYRRFAATLMLAVFFFIGPATGICEEESYSKPTESVQNILSSMPMEDRQNLESLFRYLMRCGDFAYTLFGDKPAALSSVYADLDYTAFFELPAFNQWATIYKGWEVWQKYKSLFPSNSFLLNDYRSSDCNLIGFSLYNKQKVQALYDQHQPLMDSVFGNVNQIQIFLNSRVESAVGSHDVEPLPCNEHLFDQALGIILGYDEVNVERFRNKSELTEALSIGPFSLDGLDPKITKSLSLGLRIQKSIPIVSSHFRECRTREIIRQLNDFSEKWRAVELSQRNGSLSPVTVPRYMAFEGDLEVVERQKAYDNIRDRLRDIYYSENFLEIILSRLQS